MTDNDEPNMNTLAAIEWLLQPEVVERWENVMLVWNRGDFSRWLKIWAIDSGKMSMKNACECVDWPYVVDALFLTRVIAADE